MKLGKEVVGEQLEKQVGLPATANAGDYLYQPIPLTVNQLLETSVAFYFPCRFKFLPHVPTFSNARMSRFTENAKRMWVNHTSKRPKANGLEGSSFHTIHCPRSPPPAAFVMARYPPHEGQGVALGRFCADFSVTDLCVFTRCNLIPWRKGLHQTSPSKEGTPVAPPEDLSEVLRPLCKKTAVS